LKFLKIFTFEELSRTAYLIKQLSALTQPKKKGGGEEISWAPKKKREG